MANNMLQRYVLFQHQDMGSNFSSNPMPFNAWDNAGIQFKWIGTPVGQFGIQVSNDYFPGDSTSPFNAGTWDDIPLDRIPTPTGVSGSCSISLNQLPFSYYRVVYSYTSGSGLATATLSHRGI